MAETQANIEFVQEIEKHPWLYNNKLPDYVRKDVTNKTWAEIGTKFQLTGPEAREKWKNLRAVFVRLLKRSRSESATAHKKPYYLANFMDFAIPFIKTTGIPPENLVETSNATCFSDDNNELQISESWEQTQSTETIPADKPTSIPQQQSSLFSSNSQSILVELSPHQTSDQSAMELNSARSLPSQEQLAKIISKKRMRTFVTHAEGDISAYFKRNKSKVTDDCDSTVNSNKMFLLSVVPGMKKMNDNQRRLFKRKVLEIVDNIFDHSEVVNNPLSLLSTPSPCADEKLILQNTPVAIKEEIFKE